MSDVNEEYSRLFFEKCNFLVRTNVKYYVIDGRVGGDSDIDLVVYNLKPDRQHPHSNFILQTQDLRGIEYAIVETKGWHTTELTPSRIRQTPRIFNFVRPESIECAKKLLDTANFKKILIISMLPISERARAESIRLLKDGGVDHILEFKTIVEKLWEVIEENKSYDSEILQTMRLVKKYINI